jgi:serine/threonine protein kinase
VHRDLKPENIIICPETKAIKIIDFGLATCIDEPSYIFIRCGTPGFIAPEILKIKDLATARLGVESDMFSVGAIYYRMLYGKAMFPGNDQQEVLHHNKMMRVRLPESNGVYGEMELLKGMLEVNPSARITPEQALQHVFLREKRIVSNRLALRSL